MHGYVALNKSKKIIGCLIYTVSKINPTAYELTFLFIDKKHRGKGIGTMLMTHLMSQIMNKPAIVKVKIEGHENDAFYRKFCFKSADETMDTIPLLKNELPIKRHGFNYMYFTTFKYIQMCNLMSMLMLV